MRLLRSGVAIGTAVLVLGGPAATNGPAAAASAGPQTVIVTVTGIGNRATLSTDHVQPGPLQLMIDNATTPHLRPVGLVLVRMRDGYEVGRVLKDLEQELRGAGNQAAAATRDLDATTALLGGGDTPGYGPYFKSATVWLPGPGTYYVINVEASFDPGSGPAVVGTLHADVSSTTGAGTMAPSYTGTVTLGNGSADTITLDGYMASQGTIRVVNHGDSVHLLRFNKVGDDVTDAKVQNEYNELMAGRTPKTDPAGLNSMNKPITGPDALTVGRTSYLTYVVPPGTYLLQCVLSDAISGIDNAYAGMHLVVHVAN